MKRLLAVWLLAFAMLVAANDAVAQGDDVPLAPRAEVWGAVEVTEDAEEEIDGFPVTADDLEDEREGEEEEPSISEDESEL